MSRTVRIAVVGDVVSQSGFGLVYWIIIYILEPDSAYGGRYPWQSCMCSEASSSWSQCFNV
ncbi:hypothetical protein QQ045_009048 [Rhodiola kirilowii]